MYIDDIDILWDIEKITLQKEFNEVMQETINLLLKVDGGIDILRYFIYEDINRACVTCWEERWGKKYGGNYGKYPINRNYSFKSMYNKYIEIYTDVKEKTNTNLEAYFIDSLEIAKRRLERIKQYTLDYISRLLSCVRYESFANEYPNYLERYSSINGIDWKKNKEFVHSQYDKIIDPNTYYNLNLTPKEMIRIINLFNPYYSYQTPFSQMFIWDHRINLEYFSYFGKYDREKDRLQDDIILTFCKWDRELWNERGYDYLIVVENLDYWKYINQETFKKWYEFVPTRKLVNPKENNFRQW